MSSATLALETRRITTRSGLQGEVLVGGSGPDLVYLHGAAGTSADEPLLGLLAERFTVHAPIWPGFGVDETETALETMLDFALHGWDIVDALDLAGPPTLVGHSMGGMIAAEMAAIAPRDLSRLVLCGPAGLWRDDLPVPDIFALLPYELAEVLFHDADAGERRLMAGANFSDDSALSAFMVARARSLGTAGKILFPIPNRGLAKRLHRIVVPVTLIWGESDKLYPRPYAKDWADAIADASLVMIAEAGHELVGEQPEAVAAAI